MNKYFKKIKETILVYLKDPFLLKKWDQPDYYQVRNRVIIITNYLLEFLEINDTDIIIMGLPQCLLRICLQE
jgi:hypothetical protein